MENSTLKIELHPENKPRGDPFRLEPYDYIHSISTRGWYRGSSNRKKYFHSSLKNGTKISVCGDCPVLNGFYKAYGQHYPVSISPDLIWLLILQGFSHYVNSNSEKLRNIFVDFEGKKQLSARFSKELIEQLTPEDYEMLVDDLTKQISNFVGKDLISTLESNFSTTSKDEKTVSQMSIMSTFKKYFDYCGILCGCGFPYINLEGTLEDWINLKEKAIALKKYFLKENTADLNNRRHFYDEEMNQDFIERIEPSLDKIIETKRGNIDYGFWNDMIVTRENQPELMLSGMESSDFIYINGWLLKFFPYDKDEKYHPLDEIRLSNVDGRANQMLEIPFKIISANGLKTYNMIFKAGILGIDQNPESLLVTPKIGWYVHEEETKK